MKRKYPAKAGILSLLLTAAMAVFITGCGQGKPSASSASSASSGTSSAASGASAKKDIVNIGVTDTLGSLNPLTIDATEINKYSTAMMFLPLVELDKDVKFEPSLADSITVGSGNKLFTIHLNKDAKWSDGKPVTADDVAFTITRLCSPVINNSTMSMYTLEGTNDNGFVKAGATTVSGIRIVDDHTLTLALKTPMNLLTFENSYARYIMTIPKHVLGGVSESALAKDDWFNHPTVVDGPYLATAVDPDHYVSYKANTAYWKGAPKIGKMNIKIVAPDQILSGLRSGEIDFVQPTMAQIPEEDYASIQKLGNVNAVFSNPVTTQSLFLNTQTIPDVRVRQAILYAVDRQMLLKNLLYGKGEVDDGFLTSASPYYDSSVKATAYDAAKAKALLKEAGWDGSKTLSFYVNSGDATFVNGSNVIVQELKAVGINAEVHTVDLSTLMQKAGAQSFDLLAVQYTYAPIDPYPDVKWLLGGKGSWTNFGSDAVNTELEKIQETSDSAVVKQQYTAIDRTVQQQVPMINLYVISALGASGKDLSNAHPDVYGSFTNIQDWQFQ